jgi:hypothetical protein
VLSAVLGRSKPRWGLFVWTYLCVFVHPTGGRLRLDVLGRSGSRRGSFPISAALSLIRLLVSGFPGHGRLTERVWAIRRRLSSRLGLGRTRVT